jgi:DNA-binding response OmpR family regulator
MNLPQAGVTKILIVGADRHTQDILSQVLSGSRFQILTVANEREALLQFSTSRPDLIILDMNSWDSLPRIHEMSGVPIIALGKPDDPEGEIESLDHGADYFLTKPFGNQELCARIRALLRRKKSQVSTLVPLS